MQELEKALENMGDAARKATEKIKAVNDALKPFPANRAGRRAKGYVNAHKNHPRNITRRKPII